MDVSRLQLKDDGFVEVSYPAELRAAVQEAVASWQEFCRLPTQAKQEFSGNDRFIDFGYNLRQKEKAHEDGKEFFHVQKRNLETFRDIAARTQTGKEAMQFVEAVDSMLELVKPLILDFAGSVEREYKLDGFLKRVEEVSDNWTFRFLHYFGGEVLANPHIDRGGFTLHLYESHAGGEYLDAARKWHPWPIDDRTTLIFPSIVLQHFSQCVLTGLCHRVMGTEETKDAERFALVSFIDFNYERKFNPETLLPQLSQERGDSWAYDMSFAELDAYFIDRTDLN